MPVSAERTAEGPTNSMKPQPIRRRTRIKIIEFLMRHPLALVDTNRKRTGAWRPNKGSASLRFCGQQKFMDLSTLHIENDLQTCLDSCLQCLVACELCAAACFEQEDSQQMTRCIQLGRICADLCSLAARAIARKSDFVRQACALCALACRSCGKECARHSHSEQCKRCAAACRRCEKACQRIAAETAQTA